MPDHEGAKKEGAAAFPLVGRGAVWSPTLLFCSYLLGAAAAGVLLVPGWRAFALIAGWDAAASLAAVAAIALGAAGGALWGGLRAERQPAPAAMIGILLALFALAALAAPLSLRAGLHAYLVLWPLLGGTSAGAFVLRFLLALLPFAVPAALFFALPPFLSRLIVPRRPGSGLGVGLSSGLTLTGLGLGTGIGGILILPALGLRGSLLMGVALAGVAAAGTVLLRQRGLEGHGALLSALMGAPPPGPQAGVDSPQEVRLGGALAGGMLLFGFAAWAYLIIWTRTLTFATGGTMTGRAAVGAIFLVGIGLGAFVAAGLTDRVGAPCLYLSTVVACCSLVAYLSMHLAPQTSILYLRLTPLLEGAGVHHVPAVLAAVALMLPTCLLLGAALPVLPMAAGVRQRPEVGAASLIAIGAIVAEAMVALLVIPAFGLRRALSLAAAIGLLAAILFLGGVRFKRPPQRTTASLLLLAMMIAVGLFSASWDPQLVAGGFYRYGARSMARYGSPSGYLAARRSVRPIHYHEGVNATVMVEQSFVESPGGAPIEALALTVDGRVEATTGDDVRTQVLQAHLPILLHGPTDRVLQIGYLNGVTSGSILRHPVKSLAIIEEEPALYSADDAFSAYNGDPLDDPRVVRIADSARARLRADQTLYDVIILSSATPWLPSSASLLTAEGFRILGARLAQGGVLSLRLQIDSTTGSALHSVLKTVAESFPSSLLFRLSANDLVIAASDDPLALDVGWMRNVIESSPDVTADLARVNVLGPPDLVLTYRLDRDGLLSIAERAATNTDRFAPVEIASARHLDVHDNAPLAGAIEAAWAGLTPVLKNYGARSQDRASFLYTLAKSYLGLAGEPARALDLARDLEGLGETARARWVRGESLFQQKDVNGALEEWRAVLVLEPENLDALFSLGTFYLDARDYWQAETFLERAARHHPDIPVVHYHYGRTLYFLGRHDRAIRELTMARDLGGQALQYPLVDYLVGVASLRLGRHEKAASSLKAYLEWAYAQTTLTRLEVDAHLKLAEVYDAQERRLDALRERQKGEDLRVRIQAHAGQRTGPGRAVEVLPNDAPASADPPDGPAPADPP